MHTEEIIQQSEQRIMPVYARYKIALDHGEGVYLYDSNGKRYLDFASGIGVMALGYGNEGWSTALKSQIDKLTHTSNLFYSEVSLNAAEHICKATGLDRAFLTNSGAEAIEGALKLARKYYYREHGTADSRIIACEHSFHGRTMGALSVTGTAHYREAFEPLIGGVDFVRYNDVEGLESAITDKTCAILLETLQGEGGIHPIDATYLQRVRELCDQKGILLILDEIQCGMGRTGKLFAYEHYDIKPDIVTTAKALGCGVPVGAFAANERVATAFEAGDHGTTYGGNPFAAAAVNAVFEQYEQRVLVKHVQEMGGYLYRALERVKKEKKGVVAHRGMGLMQGLEFDAPVRPIIEKAMESGVIFISAGANVLRFLPPLIIEQKDVDDMVAVLSESIG